MNFDVLRQKILEKAIRGELVPQLENEPEAAQIGDSPKEVPFAIPEKWKWLKLGSVFRLKAGKFISSSEIKEAGKYPCFGGNGIRGYVDHYNKEGKFPLIGRQGALCGNINIADGRFYATEHAVVADGGELIDSDCAAYFLKQLNLNQYATKTAQPGISVKRISETPFPLPSLEEQRRIVTKINQLFEQIDRAEKAYNELSGPLSDRFRQLCLEKAIQGKLVPQLESEPVEKIGETPEDVPFAIPEKWKWVRFSNVATLLNGRAYSKSELLSKAPDRVPVLRVGNFFTNGSWYYSDLNLEPNKYCDNNDLLFAWSASFGPKIWNGGRCIYHYHIWKVVCSKYVDKEWLYFWLLSMAEKLKNTSGRGSTMIHITKKETEKVPLALPPIKEQQRIVNTIKSLFHHIDNINVHLN